VFAAWCAIALASGGYHAPLLVDCGSSWTAARGTGPEESSITLRGHPPQEAADDERAVSSDEAPVALGPHSQAIVAGGFVFCSGMAGIDPATGTTPEGIEAQTEQALVNLAAVLGAAGASMADVVKTTIFYADVEDFTRLNEVYARHMPDPAPAPSAPAHVRLPRGLLISIEAIAELPSE
jgi:2-iminobutanoate/2-iminopropanoate deaminase